MDWDDVVGLAVHACVPAEGFRKHKAYTRSECYIWYTERIEKGMTELGQKLVTQIRPLFGFSSWMERSEPPS